MSRARLFAYGLGVVLCTAVSRIPLLLHSRAIDDERIYSVVATEMLDGGLPYRDAIERKPPLLFWTYAAIYRVVGKYDWPGLHLAALLWLLLSMAGCYLLGRALFGPAAGLWAALLYGIYQAWWSGGTLALNGEMLMNLPLLWAAFLVLRPAASRLRPELAAAGALCCAGFLLKQPAAIAAVPFGLYLLSPWYRKSRGLRTVQGIGQAALFTAGFFALLAAVLLRLRSQGILHEAIYWSIGDHTDPYFYWLKGLAFGALFALIAAPLTLGAARAARDAGRPPGSGAWEAHRPELLALLLWLGASALGVAAGGRFYTHYFIQLVPPLVILAAPFLAGYGRVSWRRVARVWVAVAGVALAVAHMFRLPEREDAAATYVKTHSDPTDRIFVWGQSAELYLDAERRPASRYIATFPLTGYIFGSPLSWDPHHDTSDRIRPGAWDNLAQDFHAHPPLYIVDTDAARAIPKYPMERFPFLRDFVARNYHLVERVSNGWIYRRSPVATPLPPPPKP